VNFVFPGSFSYFKQVWFSQPVIFHFNFQKPVQYVINHPDKIPRGVSILRLHINFNYLLPFT